MTTYTILGIFKISLDLHHKGKAVCADDDSQMCRRQRPQRTFKALSIARLAEDIGGVECAE